MRPVTVEEAAGLLADAAAAGRRVRIGEDLSTEGLDRVLEHEAGDLTCSVEAGIRLSALQEALSAAGQRLSLDPPGDPTIGACLARRLSGPLSHRFGTPRDLVLGVTLVLGDGTIASSGGKVVKNVAGYDLGKLVCGSEGRLALIARVSLRLHPLPAASGTLVVETINVTPAQELRPSRTVMGGTDTLKIVERFTPVDADTIDYQFTVTDPEMFTKTWTALTPMSRIDTPIFEYACHEGNYAIVNMLKGARQAEEESAAAKR